MSWSTSRLGTTLAAVLLVALITPGGFGAPVTVHNPSFESASNSPWLGPNVSSAPDSRSFDGSKFGFVGTPPDELGQIVAVNPGDAGTQLQLLPYTVYTLTHYGMTGGDVRYAAAQIRGAPTASNSLGAVIASELYDIEQPGSSRPGYFLAPDGVT